MATPFALMPQQMTEEEFMRQLALASAPRHTPGGMMTPATTPAPQVRPSLQALLAGMASPFGFAPPTQQVVPQQTLTGEQYPAVAESMDMGAIAAQDPAGAAIGQAIGLGPAFRAAGVAGRAIAGSPPVQWLGRQLARPAVQAGVTAPLALGGASLATASDTQAPPPPTLGPRTTTAAATLAAARKSLEDLASERRRLQGLAQRFDPDTFDWTSGTPAERRQRVMEMQEAIGTTPDGTSGPKTREALAAYRRRQMAAIEALGPRETTIRADITKAEEGRAEAERLDLQDTGSRRLREAAPGWLEQAAPMAGYAFGGAAGYFGRAALGRAVAKNAGARAGRADELATRFGQGTVPERIGPLNQYWTEGGGRPAPFGFSPGARPYPWQSIAEAPAADRLYRPGAVATYGPGAAVLGSGAAETGTAMWMLPGAHRALEEAQKAADARPTEANIQALVHARQMAAMWESLNNFGRGTLLGGLGGEGKAFVKQGAGTRPASIGRAEGERGLLDLLLTPEQTPQPPTPPPGPQPVWDPRSNRWRLNGGFVRAPEGMAPPSSAPLSLGGPPRRRR